MGALLIDKTAWDQVADIVTTEDFYRPDHRLIYEALGELVARRPAGRRGDRVRTARASWPPHRCRWPCLPRHARGRYPTAANARSYAQIVRERALLRRLIEAGREIASSVFNDDGSSAHDLVDRAEGLVFENRRAGHPHRRGRGAGEALLPALIDKIDEWHSHPDQLRGPGHRVHGFR